MLNVGVCCAVVSVPCSLVVTCWERADLLAVVFVVFCHFWHRETGLSPPVKCFTDHFKAVLLLWIIYVFLSCVFMPLCVSVYLCLVVTCWERADLLALLCGV